jgi:single-strand DNA-binding protein
MSQKIIITGHLGKDPEGRYTPAGKMACSFPVATSRSYTKNGEKVKETTWFRVTAWGNQGEACNDYLKKGSLVYVEGTLTPDPTTGGPPVWADKKGEARANFEVNASVVEFLSAGGTRPKDDLQGEEEF